MNIFCKKYAYKAGYFVLFGKRQFELKTYLNSKSNIDKMKEFQHLNNIIVICKSTSSPIATIIRLSDLLK